MTRGRFTNEEIEAYRIIQQVILEDALAYTTVIRTGCSFFENPTECARDITPFKAHKNPIIASLFTNCKTIHVDMPSDQPDRRARSALLLKTHLAGCTRVYKPPALDVINANIKKHIDEEHKLERQVHEMEKQAIAASAEIDALTAKQKDAQLKALQHQKDLDEAKKSFKQAEANMSEAQKQMAKQKEEFLKQQLQDQKDAADRAAQQQKRMEDMIAVNKASTDQLMAQIAQSQQQMAQSIASMNSGGGRGGFC